MQVQNIKNRIFSFFLAIIIMTPLIISEEIVKSLYANAISFEDGYYYIEHVKSGKLVDIKDMSNENGGTLQLYNRFDYHTNQVFKIESIGNNCYKIKSLYNGKVLEGMSMSISGFVYQYDNKNLPTQEWELVNMDSDNYFIKHCESGDLLYPINKEGNNGTNLVLRDQNKLNSNSDALFKLVPIAVGNEDAKDKREKNEKECYEFLDNLGLNSAAISGILASMYVENKFVFGKEALEFYWNNMSTDKTTTSEIQERIKNVDSSEQGAVMSAYHFTIAKNTTHFPSIYKDLFNTINNIKASANEPMTLAKDGFWDIYNSYEWLIWPTVSTKVTTEYGYSDWHAKHGYNSWHPAIDIGAPYGDAVYAVASGTIIQSEYLNGVGNRITIDHGNGIISSYNHLSVRNVKVGDKVSQKKVIGKVGNTGGNYGYHLDFQLGQFNGCYDGSYIGYRHKALNYDPLKWISPKNEHLKSIIKSEFGTYIDYLSQGIVHETNAQGNGQGGGTYYQEGIYEICVDDYLNIRSLPTNNSTSIGKLYNSYVVEVKSISNNFWGEIKHNEVQGWICLDYTKYLRPLEKIQKPNSPVLSLVSASDVALNTISTVSWSAINGADSYNLTVYDEAGAEIVKQERLTTTNTSFTLDNAGTYTVKAVAVNSKYSSDIATMSQTITVHPNSTVIFLSEKDGNELSKQSVAYGADAATPEIPTKQGFTFIGWDGNYTSVMKNITITAKWERNKYNVVFYNATGSILDSQRVLYEDAAVEPKTPVMKGYTFQGWDKKFDSIKDNMEIYPIFAWNNYDLPVIINDVKAERDSSGYNVSYSLKNAPGKSTECRLVISLKTSEGKLITYTESNAYNLREDTVIKDTVFVPSQEVATKVEVNAVQKFSLVIPIAENKSCTITGNAYTNWSTSKPPANALKTEQRTEYRYRTKTTKESKEKLASPWILEKETLKYTDWSAWSAETENFVASSDTREVSQRQESRKELMGYNMYHYCTQDNVSPYKRRYRNYSINGNYSLYSARPSYGEHHKNYITATTSQLNSATIISPSNWFDGAYRGSNSGNVDAYLFPFDTNYIWYKGDAVYNNYTVTLYKYRDRTKYTVYNYYQLSDYSEWTTEKPATSNDKIIEERTVYRYVPANTNMIEDTSGEVRTIEGSVDPIFAGKQAILFVYKIDEAADYTNEAVAQTIIGENGDYSFKFKLREEPTRVSINGDKKPTGDFTVTLGIEGTSSVIYLDPIKAPIPEYTVEYVDHDGKVLFSTTVKDGESAPIPNIIPEREGYTFAGWNNNPSEIHSNITMTAVYVKNTYTVAFIDWQSENIVLQQYSYGDPILPPESKAPEGYEFIGWDILLDGEAFVTENMVAVAIYEPLELEITFVDYEDNVISKQMVQYGNNAILPEDLENQEDRSFMGWSIDENTIITNSMTVKPLVVYTETAENPQISLESNVYDSTQSVKITTSDDSKIYYTLDGTDPVEYGSEYKDEIILSHSCVLNCVAKAINKNNSEIITRIYAINGDDAYTEYMDYDLLPEYVRENTSEYNVMSTTGYRYLIKNDITSKREYENYINTGWEVESEAWSDWSEWSSSLNGTEDLIIEQKSKDADAVEMPFYQYSHWRYFDEETSKYLYSATELEEIECEFETIDSPEKLPVAEFVDGVSSYSYNGQNWFNQTAITKSIVLDEKVYQYRYKIITMTRLSDWVEKLPNGTEALEKGEVFCYREPAHYILTIKDENDSIIYNELVLGNELINADNIQIHREGYIFDGFFTSNGTEWDVENDKITENIVLTAKYSKVKYTVTFMDDDMILSTKTVDSFSYAAPPQMYNKEGLVFAGWDNDGYMNLTEDTVVKAKYIPNEDLPTLTIEKSDYYLYPNTQTNLVIKTNNIDPEIETIVLKSMNSDIATVTDDGKLIAVNEGETHIVISELSTRLTTVCAVNVSLTPSNTIDINFGDVDDNKTIDAIDASNILAEYAVIATNGNPSFTDKQMKAADINEDGEVDAIDASLVLAYYTYISTGGTFSLKDYITNIA